MNIALFSDCFLPSKNGVITSILQLKEGLEKRGHHVVVVSVKGKNSEKNPPDMLLFRKIPHDFGTKQGYGIGIINLKKLISFLKKHEIDIIHSHTEGIIGWAGKYAAKKLNIPRVATSHTLWEHYKHYSIVVKTSSIIKTVMRFYYKDINAIVTPSLKSKKFNNIVAPEIKKYIIPNGIDYKKFIPSEIKNNELSEIKKNYGIQEGDKIILYVGRMSVEKRIENLIESLDPLLKKHNKIKLLLIGDGPDMKKLQKRAKELNIENNLIFAGFINWEQMYKFYMIADVFVSVSLSENNPMTLIEATMSAMPVIARKDESSADFLKNGWNGYVADTDDEIAGKLEDLIFDNEKLKVFSENSFELSKKYTVDNHVMMMENLYKKLIEKKNPGV